MLLAKLAHAVYVYNPTRAISCPACFLPDHPKNISKVKSGLTGLYIHLTKNAIKIGFHRKHM